MLFAYTEHLKSLTGLIYNLEAGTNMQLFIGKELGEMAKIGHIMQEGWRPLESRTGQELIRPPSFS